MCLDLANAFCFPILGTICSFLHICDFPLRDIKWLNRFNLIFGQQKSMNCWRFLFNSWFHRSFKSAKRKYHTKLSFWNLGKAIPLVIYLSARKPSRCGCRKIYNQNRPLIKTLLQQQRNSGLFHPAKWNLHILVYNSIFTVPFSEETLFSFLSVFDYCWAGATITVCAPQDQIWVYATRKSWSSSSATPDLHLTALWKHRPYTNCQ